MTFATAAQSGQEGIVSSIPEPRYIVPFDAATHDDYPRMGGKCSRLARMTARASACPAASP